MSVLSFLLASSHYHPLMNLYHISLLILVVLSAYSESPQHAQPPDSTDPIGVTVCTNSSSAKLGVLAPGLPQIEVYKSTLPQNEVFRTTLPQNEVFRTTLPQNEVFRTTLPQHEVFVSLLPQKGVFILPQNEVLKSVPTNCPLFCHLKMTVDFLLDVQVN